MSPSAEEPERRYPAPLASHEHVVNDVNAFWDTLKRFHSQMGTKYMVPVIGGKELDLHVLYVEATKRGGYEKVVAEKKWREVGIVFRFSPTTTSASFVLRKHYLNLLYHYEQVHLFRIQGPIFAPTAFPANGPSSSRSELAIVEYSSAPPKPAIEVPDLPSYKGGSTFTATGTIEAKFECGYLVTVKLDSEVLSGVLYHPGKQPPQPSSASPPHSSTPKESNSPKRTRHNDGGVFGRGRGRGRRRGSRRGGGDPTHPKPNRSGYNFYFAEKHYKLKSLYPNKEREFTKMIGHSWSNLSPEERSVYQNIGLQDKERYKRELKEYKEKQKVMKLGLEIGERSHSHSN